MFVFKSRKHSAVQFRAWVTGIVLLDDMSASGFLTEMDVLKLGKAEAATKRGARRLPHACFEGVSKYSGYD